MMYSNLGLSFRETLPLSKIFSRNAPTFVKPVCDSVEYNARDPWVGDLRHRSAGRAVVQVVIAHQNHAPWRPRPLHVLQQLLRHRVPF